MHGLIQPQLVRGRKRRRRVIVWACLGAALAAAAFLASPFYSYFEKNFHAVVRHEVYRSRQMDPDVLERELERHHIRTILNLRGANPELDWYNGELAVAKRHGVQHYDLALSAKIPPNSRELRRLIHIYDRCEKPLLIHCESGADRSGFAAMVFLLLHDDGIDHAQEQMSISYGRLPWKRGRYRFPMFVDMYRAWLREHNVAHSSANFRRWACEEYTRPVALGLPDRW